MLNDNKSSGECLPEHPVGVPDYCQIILCNVDNKNIPSSLYRQLEALLECCSISFHILDLVPFEPPLIKYLNRLTVISLK